MKRLPVTVLSGFLGSGKTTLLNNVLNQIGRLKNYKVAVIVNDMSEVNIDAELVKTGSLDINHTKESLIQMTNGCICCTLREDLLIEISKIAKSKKFDAILIESSGISEPLQVAETFSFEDESGDRLMDHAQLDTLVTVIDGHNFQKDFESVDTLSDRNQGISSQDQRSIVNLLIEQIEFANVILINKIDLVSDAQKQRLYHLIKKLNPSAKIHETKFGNIHVDKILNTKLFTFDWAQMAPGWLKEARGDHIPETEEYGISSFLFSANKPFHPERLHALLQSQKLTCVVRSKGWVWLASRPKTCLLWSQAGSMITLDPYGYWKTPEQKLVVIGVDMDKETVKKLFEETLLTDDEFEDGKYKLKKFNDPFK